MKSLLLICLIGLTGCTAMDTMIKHRKLKVDTKMSKTIFLDPIEEKKVYLDIKNTSSKRNLAVKEHVSKLLEDKGYKVVCNLKQATVMLQGNVLYIGEMKEERINELLNAGFGAETANFIAGAAALSAIQDNYNAGTIAGGGLAGMAIGGVADNMVKNVIYTMIVDLRVSVRNEDNKTWDRYENRIISRANKVNLKFETARPRLIDELSNSIAGIL